MAAEYDVELSDGTQVLFDLKKISMKEWRSLFTAMQDDDEAAAILAKFSGVGLDAIQDFSIYDWKKFMAAAIKKVNAPLADPT
jgi:hypothetical protein